MATTFAPQPSATISSSVAGALRLGPLRLGPLRLGHLHFGPLAQLPAVLADRENRRKIVSFVSIGAVSTGVYLLLYVGLRQLTDATTANFLAQLISTIGSTAANRKITFGVTDQNTVARHHAQMIGVFLFGLLVNSGALALLAMVNPTASSVTELAVLTVSGVAATILRIMMMRRWAH